MDRIQAYFLLEFTMTFVLVKLQHRFVGNLTVTNFPNSSDTMTTEIEFSVQVMPIERDFISLLLATHISNEF